MSIELLWVIPIVALGLLPYLIFTLVQRHRQETQAASDAQKKITQTPSYQTSPSAAHQQDRLGEIETKISTLTATLLDQQKLMDGIQRENAAYTTENKEMKKKLYELQKEYDLILSENYSLRARIKNFNKKSAPSSAGPTAAVVVPDNDVEGVLDPRLYGDTRVMSIFHNGDASEVDISELG